MSKDKDKVIKAGYNVEVTTWENDGDNYNTKTFVFKTLEEVKLFHKFLMYFECDSYGNGYLGVEEVLATLSKEAPDVLNWLVSLYPGKLRSWENSLEERAVHMAIADYIGWWCDGDYFRTFDSAKYYYVPEELTFPMVKL